MKHFSKFGVLLAAFAAVAVTACSSDPAETPEPDTDEPSVAPVQVWFSPDDPASFSVCDDDDHISVTLCRSGDMRSVTVKIVPEVSPSYSYIFDVPGYVSFAEGAETALLSIVFRPALLEEDAPYDLKLTFESDDVEVPASQTNTVSISVVRRLWEYVGTGRLRGGDVFTTMWGENEAIANAEIDVEIYENRSSKGLYKIADPWAAMLVKTLGFPSIEAAEAKGFVFSEEDFILDCTTPTACYAEMQYMGIDDRFYNDGPYWIRSRYQPAEADFQGYDPGVYRNGVLTFPAEGLVVWLPDVAERTLWVTNLLGRFRLLFPGSYCDLSLAYGGVDVSAGSPKVLFDVDCGPDTSAVQYVVVSGDAEAQAADIAARIADGSIAGAVTLPVDGSGKVQLSATVAAATRSTIVAVPQNKEGQTLVDLYAAQSFYYSGVTTAATECQFEMSVGLVSAVIPSMSEELGDHEAIAFELRGKDIISLWRYTNQTYIVDNYVNEEAGRPLSRLIEESGTAAPDDWMRRINTYGYYRAAVTDRIPSTDYTVAMKAVNVYGNSVSLRGSVTTAAAPVAGTSSKRIAPYALPEAPEVWIEVSQE